MVVVQINFSCTWGSTGNICDSISNILSEQEIENYIFYIYGDNPQNNSNYIKYGDWAYTKFQALKSKIFGNYGFNSILSTKWLIRKLDQIKPDIVHIHNIHGHDCHFGMLFKYLRAKGIKTFYTFHDCWAFTGYCPHFTMEKCDNWLKGCGNCPLSARSSWFVDKSAQNFNRKREALSGLDLTIITPSQWLGDLVKKSFLKDYPVKIIHNGIDLSVFRPMKSTFREAYKLQNKKIVLGVALMWSKAKGLDVFLQLAKKLPKEYQIVLVGTDDRVDKLLPPNIISIHRTQSQQELAEIYSAADVFVNPTREEVLGLTNIEALACGTPGITFNSSGASECYDKTCGSVVDCDDLVTLEREIIRICTENPYLKETCIKTAKKFDKNEKFKEYLELYERVNASGIKRN